MNIYPVSVLFPMLANIITSALLSSLSRRHYPRISSYQDSPCLGILTSYRSATGSSSTLSNSRLSFVGIISSQIRNLLYFSNAHAIPVRSSKHNLGRKFDRHPRTPSYQHEQPPKDHSVVVLS